MTDPTERDPTLPPAANETDAEVPSDEDFEPLETDEDRPESDYVAIAAEYTAQRDYGAIRRASDPEETTALGDSAISTGRGARGRAGVRSAFTSGSSPSEVAVHVGDSFVVVVVLAFVAIFAYGLLGGVGGFLTPIPTAAPLPSGSLAPSVAPSGSLAPSTAPSASSAPSGSPAASGGASPSAGPTGGSPAASTSPVASPSAAAPSPSPSPAASPSG
jgi:hypothetical protein